MERIDLLAPSTPLGYPAPYWFLVLFKVLGFTLHMVPMHLWFAGILLAMLWRRGSEPTRKLSDALMRQMPVLVALGINFGIVPLLFIQVAYYKVFYPATILMAWPWMAVIVLLIPAYYGIYLYVGGLRSEQQPMAGWRQAAGWISMILFIVIGFLFANAMTLMTRVGSWFQIWKDTSVAGAPLGTALNVGDPTLWPRWLMMFGLALTTVAAYVVVHAAFFARSEDDAYRGHAVNLAFWVHTVGMIWFALMGAWYVFGSWPASLRGTMFSGASLVLTVLTAVSPGLVWLLILIQRRNLTPALALVTGIVQFLVLGLNAISRQVVQNLELKPYLDVTQEQVRIQWSPLIVFLLLFVAGLGVVFWMLRRVIVEGKEASDVDDGAAVASETL